MARAQNFFAAGTCAIVLASKPSEAAARADARARFSDKHVSIYRASNGWYALTWKTVPIAQSRSELARLKQRGEIPSDALCSRGSGYINRAAYIAPRATSAPSRVSDVEASLLEPLNANLLTRSEKRFLQLALAFEGDYVGLLDGAWGKISARAMQSYSARAFGTAALNLHMTALAARVFNVLDRDGWEIFYNDSLKMSYLFPFKAFVEGAHSDEFVNFEHTKSSLRISLARGMDAKANALHRFSLLAHAGHEPAYTVRKNSFAVTSVTKRDGTMLYVRSHFLNGAWSSVVLSAAPRDLSLFRAVSASITQGRAGKLLFETDGYLSANIETTLALLDRQNGGANSNRSQSAPIAPQVVAKPKGTTPPQIAGSGSGFIVTQEGHVLTNNHVIQGCKRVEVDGQIAQVSARDKSFDLALLSLAAPPKSDIAEFASRPAGLNADITVVGFPLNSVLGGLNVTRGAVSAQIGVGGDGTRMQISAPVQPGNSGGPVVDKSGAVVGVVVSRLKSRLLDGDQVDVPQNVNFAIRAEIAKLFLYQNGVVPKLALQDAPALEPEALAQRAKGFTKLIKCFE